MYVLLHPEVIHSAADIFRSWQGGNVFYGCILGGLTGSLFYWCRRPYPLCENARRGCTCRCHRPGRGPDRLLFERLL